MDAIPTTPNGELPVAVTDQQRQVVAELQRINGRFAELYLGALQSLTQVHNPIRFVLCAHALRELISKLTESVGAPIRQGNLKQRVYELRKNWPDEAMASVFNGQANAVSAIRRVQKFMGKLQLFFDEFDREYPTRREQMGRFFAATDPSNRRLPSELENTHTESWLETRDALNGIAHDGSNPADTEFRQLCDSLDRMLLDRLRPRVFEGHEEIDRIIAEGEGGE